MSYESVGWPPHRLELDGVDAVGVGFRAGPNVSVFRTANAHPDAGIFIGERVMLFDGVRLLLGHENVRLQIGDGVVVNVGAYLSGEGGLEIGDEVLIGAQAKLLSAGHEIHGGDPVIARNPIVGAPICIGRGAWIGAGAIVLPGVSIGAGAVVGAGSVVTRNVDEMAVVAGNPAKLLRYRGDKRMPTPIWRRLLGRWLKA